MKLAIIYNPNEHKFQPSSYSQTYKHMLNALIMCESWSAVQIVAPGLEIEPDVDVIIIYDIHSSYHVEFPGLEKHKALKYTYFNDPHQEDMQGIYKDNTPVKKLGIEERVNRAMKRNVDFIICPYKDGYNHFLAPVIGNASDDMLMWFPVAPKKQEFHNECLTKRQAGILGNGHLWEGVQGFEPYKFRNWAYRQPNVDYVKHSMSDSRVPCGDGYIEFLSNWKAGLALTDWYVVPKYLEIPLAGCLCFAQFHQDYADMGFISDVNYIEVSQADFSERLQHFLDYTASYQIIADKGRELVENNYTSKHFAKAVYEHAKERI